MFKIPEVEIESKKNGAIEWPRVTIKDIFATYWKLIKGYRWAGWLVLICVALSTISQSVLAPIFYKRFFDVLAQVGDTFPEAELTNIVIAIFAFNLFAWLVYRCGQFFLTYFEARTMEKIRVAAFEYTIGHSYSFFLNNFTGSLVQKINRFMRAFESIFDRLVMDITPLFLKIGGAIAILFVIQPVIAYGMFIWIVIFVSSTYLLTRYKLKYDTAAAALDSKVGASMSDAISNHNSVLLFNGYQTESKGFGAINRKFWHMQLFRWNLQNVLDALQMFLTLLVEFFVFYYCIKNWGAGWVTVGTFALIQTYIITIGNSMWGFSRIIRSFYEGIADAREMVEVLHLQYDIKDNPTAKPLQIKGGTIEYKNINFSFGSKQVFSNISLLIKPGEKVAFIGTSGAGKSTLVKLLLRLHDVQSGEILIDGQNIKEVTQESLRNIISLVPQDPALFHRTLLENIRYGKNDATDGDVLNAAKLAHCDAFIKDLPHKYETYVGERGVKLSGGERQRVAIARALLKNAPILILDEATSSLDSHSEALIQDALNTLMKGKTTIVIAHRLSTIKNMDRIIVVSKGGVVEDGSHDELLKKEGGVYAKLWKLQAGGFEDKSIEELLEV